MARRKILLRTIGILLCAGLVPALLISCAGQAEPTDQQEATQVATETIVEEGEEVEATRIVTEEEAQATPLATQALPPPTAPALEEMAEVEWPERMRLGESDVVRLSLLPADDGYVVSAEFAEHRTVTETVSLEQLAGYDVIAAARLDGVGFQLAPVGDQPQDWQPNRPLTWRWTISPRRSGQQRLSLSLTMHWRPEAGRSLPSRQVTAFSRALDVQVAGALDMSRAQMLAAGIGALAVLLVLAPPLLRRLQRRQPLLRRVQPDSDVQLEPHPALALAGQEAALLQAVFRGYSRAAIEREFQSGYSGARTFLVLPIRQDGRADAYTIAKLGAQEAILHEYKNYETYVEHTLPPVTARIQGQPLVVNGRNRTGEQSGAHPLAALRYTFIGAPGQQPSSLRQHLLASGDPALLETLFRTFGPNWWMQRKPYAFRLAAEYDRKLPAHAVLAPAAGGSGRILDGRMNPLAEALAPGETVRLRNFAPEAYKANGQAMSLVGRAPSGQAPFRLRWLGPPPADGACGRVVATRETQLQMWTADIERHGLPDPLPHLPEMLAQTVGGSRSIIHGDLNVENALVGPGNIVWLIDFANTREGHTLFDFAHLGAELAAHVMRARYAGSGEYLEALAADRDPLLGKLQEIAMRCLADTLQPREYWLALAVSCLGALKHDNLDAQARAFLYVTAAYLLAEQDWRSGGQAAVSARRAGRANV